ncbi:MAG: TlpA disulfide reductase family protein [Thermoanaerobaculia bacterium]|nr:TlpA disulfide reductase family protein [Thermoanaerobaculia bacterium]
MRNVPVVAALLPLALAACGAPEISPAGEWRAVLGSPGGELPFTLRIETRPDGRFAAVAVNGAEEAPFSGVRIEGSRIHLDFDWYDSWIEARLEGDRMTGEWTKVAAGGTTRLPFSARRGGGPRFAPLPAAGEAGNGGVSGVWEVVFTDEDGTEPARGEFLQSGRRVTGTFLTPTGDYRYLEGSYEAGTLRLSTFDGAHAFLFHAETRPDGSLAGDFWSRDTYHAEWTAHRAEPEAALLPDAWEAVGLTNDEGRLAFTFPDLDGNPVSLDDERFGGRVVVVNLFGSWCPNCNDEAPLLAEWHRRYADRGLAIVGLGYELTGDPERDRRQLRRFAERHGIGYPLLLAGISDKRAAAATLPDLTRVVAYPTTIFVGRDGRVRRIHSGFAGPGTGAHHERLVAELEGTLQELLAEGA